MSLYTFGRVLSMQLRDIAREVTGGNRGIRPQRINPPVPWKPGSGGQLRRAILLTDLDLGGTCTIQEYTYDENGLLCTVGESLTAHDPLGELQGTGGITCCLFQVPASDPTGLAEITRVTCPNFNCVLCNSYYYYYYYYY